MDKNRLICFIACVVVIHVCQVIAADLGHMNIKLHKLSRKHDALQQEVDELWATIIRSGSQKLDHGNQTQTDDDRSTQELFTKVNKKLSEMEDLKKEIKILILYSRSGLKNEKARQREAMKNMTSEWENLKTSVETENKNLDKTFRDTEDNNDKRLNKMETENMELRKLIVEVQNDYKKVQESNEQELSNLRVENRELRNVIAEVQNDYKKIQENNEQELSNLRVENRDIRNIIYEVQKVNKKMEENMEAQNGALTDTINERDEMKQELSNVQAENRESRNIIAEVKQDYEKMHENMEAQNEALTGTINELRGKMKQELTTCDEGWEGFNGHCYLHKYPGGYSWDAAAAFCESVGSYLVEITSDAEMQFINEFTRKKDVRYGKWIGATDRDDQGNYVYQHSKLPVPEKFWRSGQPNNDDEHCVNMWDITKNGTGIIEFYDKSCSKLQNAVCENHGRSLKDAINDIQNDAYKMKRDFTKCDEGWEGFNGHCYLHQSGGTWDEAAAVCESMGSYLVEITSDAEMQFINEFMRKKNVNIGKWTGATDRDDQGNYIYQHSKLPVPDKFWRPGQPSNDDEHCVEMWDYTRNGTGIIEFSDKPCSFPYNAVCEKPS